MKARSIALHGIAVAIGALVAEGFTRVTIEPDAMFEIAFSPGAQSPSEKFGFVYTPNFDGYMRHPDNVWAVPVDFDENGFRPAASTPGSSPDDRTEVVLIAGRSMTMCYGLPNHKTIQSFMVAGSTEALAVHNTGWAGFDPLRSWHYYLDTLDRTLDVDVALFCINPGAIEQYATLPDDLGTIPRSPIQDRFFYLMDGNVRMPKDRLEDWLGPDYFTSYVVYGLLRYRAFLPGPLAVPGMRDRNGGTAAAEATQDRGNLDAIIDVRSTGETAALSVEQGRVRYAEFLTRMQTHFAARGAKFGVVFLASKGHPIDCYSDFDASLPADIPRIDLQSRLRAGMKGHEFIGLGHYNARHSEAIAKELNGFVAEIRSE